MPVSADVSLLTSALLKEVPGIVHGFTTRAGGTSIAPFDTLNLATRLQDDWAAVMDNRAAVLRALGRPQAPFLSLRQVHGDAIVEVTAMAGPNIEGDALWTRDRRAVLAVLVADCLPILLSDRGGNVVAAVHAGWRGTAKRLAASMVQRLGAAGLEPASLVAVLGPCIGPCCFEIGTDVADALCAAFPSAGAAIAPRGERFTADLWALNRIALETAGVAPAAVDILRRCTHCDPAFFSYRRDDKRTGRQAGVIGFARKN